MNVPLFWLADFVTLPDTVQALTDRLTMIGHMLDKKLEVNGETVIDLELRGNRADLFGLIGIAQDISAAWDVPLRLPDTVEIPPIDNKSKLITVEATDIVPRFTGFTVNVKVGPSPDWLTKKLSAYGMASINNVVDITNYVMIETGIPIHAFDKQKLVGERLIIRRAKKGEQMTTFMGGTVSLTSEDIALCDEKSPQAITLVGSKSSGTTETTQEILLEAAVYNQASVRRTSRRLAVRTEAGTRLEKHLDPNEVPFALSRALYLLEKLADGKVSSKTADIYPIKREPVTVDLDVSEVERLSGISVPLKQQKTILERLGCQVKEKKDQLIVSVPTFRTDIQESADLVEEVTRIVGYETVPTLILEGELPPEQTSDRIKQEDIVKKILVEAQLNEVITSSFILNSQTETFGVHGTFPPVVVLANAPDPNIATLRPTLIPNLVDYATRSLNERAERVVLFEIGKIYQKTVEKKKESHIEERKLAMIIGGTTGTKSYGKHHRPLEFFDIKGIIEMLAEQYGVQFSFKTVEKHAHPSFDPHQQAEILIPSSENKYLHLGYLGKIDRSIQNAFGMQTELFAAELSLDILAEINRQSVKPYQIAFQYPPVIEDVSVIANESTKMGEIIDFIYQFDEYIVDAKLLDVFENKRTIRITYQDPKKNLSGEEVKPIREKLLQQLEKKFGITLVV